MQYFPICICLHMLVSHTGVFLPLPCLSVSLEGRREGGSAIFPYMYMFTHAGVLHWCISPHCHVCQYLWREGEREGVQYFPICICLHMLVSHTGVFLPLPCLSVSLEGRREGGSTIFPYMFTHAGVPHSPVAMFVTISQSHMLYLLSYMTKHVTERDAARGNTSEVG